MADLDSKIPQQKSISSRGKIRFDGMTYQFVPSGNFDLKIGHIDKSTKVWCFGLPRIGEYFIHRLMCYSDNRQNSESWVGYADIIIPKQ